MPGVETMGEAQARVGSPAVELAHEFDGGTLIVESHQLALNALLCHELSAPLAAFRSLQLATASLSAVEVRAGAPWTVVALNGPRLHESSGGS